MSEMTLFEGQNSAMLAELSKGDLTESVSGGGGVTRRISIRGNRFRPVINGKEGDAFDGSTINVVIAQAAPIYRMYYAESYSADKQVSPTCWSSDTQTPADDVPANQRQADRCMDCPQNIKGSGGGDSAACKRRQKIAVIPEGRIAKGELYGMDLPGQSVFKDDKNGMGLQGYARHLKAHNTPAAAVITAISFDSNSATPRLVFKPVRALEEAELQAIMQVRGSEEAQRLVTLSVYQATEENKESAKPALFADAPTEAPVKKTVVLEEAEEIEEPKKVVKKSAAPVAEKAELSSVLEDWDD